MSGGSMDYLYSRVQEASFSLYSPERKAFSAHLKKIAKALHDIEWVDSCDYGRGDDTEAIMACITETDILAVTLDEAKRAHAELAAAIARAEAK